MNFQDPAGYWLEDTSTNGTLVNGERVAKHASVPLAEGDKVQLSFNAGGDENVLLYVSSPCGQLQHFCCSFQQFDKVAIACHRYTFKKQEPGSEKAAKRQRSSSIPDDSPDGKRTRAGDSDALLKSVAQLEQSNQV